MIESGAAADDDDGGDSMILCLNKIFLTFDLCTGK